MPLTLLPIPPSHIPHFTRISRHAFRNSNDPNNRLLYPDGVTDALNAHYTALQTDAYHNKRNIVILGVYDIPDDSPVPDFTAEAAATLPPEWLIAAARMRLEDPLTASEPESERTPPEGANVKAFHAFFSDIAQARRELMGPTTYWNLDLLTTAMEHQGRGAGKMILRWMFGRARETVAEEEGGGGKGGKVVGVPCFVEATGAGLPLYEGVGYRHRRKLTWSKEEFGGERDGELWVMVRGPERDGMRIVEGRDLVGVAEGT